MAEVVNYYHHDHGCSQEQAQEISRQFRAIRKGILDPLNTCIAVEKNFQRRVALMTGEPASATVMGLSDSE